MAEKGQIELPILADLEPLMDALDRAIEKVSKTTEQVGKQTEKITKTMEKQGQSIKKGIEEPLKRVDSTSKSVFNRMKDTVSSATTTMKEKFTSGFKTVKDKVSEVGQKIGTAIKTGINSAVQFVKTGTETMKAKFKAVGTTCTELGNKIAGIGTKMSLLVSTPVILFGKKAFNDASDYEENLNKLDVVFGDLQSKMVEFSDTALKNFGMSKNTASEMLSLFGDMGKSMGVPLDAVAEMSASLTGLAGDLASFKNIELDQAMTALKGVFTGEGESLKNLGVVMTETTLSAFALEKGMTKQYSKMSQAEKVALRYQYVMEMTKDAQGDFARTADGASNQTRSFGEALENLRITIGQKLLPIFTPIITKINDMIIKFTNVSPEIQDIAIKFGLFIAAIFPVIAIGGKLISILGGIATAIGSLSAPILIAIASVGALFVAFKNNTGGIRDTITNIVEKIQKCFSDNMPKIQEIFENTMELLQTIWADIGEPLFSTFGTLLSNISDIFIQYFPQILEIFGAVMQGISDFWNTIGKPVFDVFIEIVNWLWETIMSVMPSILSIVSGVFSSIASVWNGVLKPVLERLGTIFTDHIKPAVDKVLPPLIGIIQTLGSIIRDTFDTIIKPKIEGFVSWLQLLGRIASPILNGIMWAFDGIASAIGWALDKLNKFLNLFRSNKGEIAEAGNVGKTMTISYEADTSALTDIPNMRLGISERLGSVMNTLTNGYRFVSDFDFVDSSSSKTTQKVSVNDMKKSNNQKSTIKTAIFLDKRQIVEAIADGVDTKNNEYVELETRRIGGRVAW